MGLVDDKGPKVRFEDLLSMVGDSGRWQITIFLFTWIEGILIGCHHLSSSFLGASMDHWCNTSYMEPLQGKSWTIAEKKEFSIPMDGDTYDSCHMYDMKSLGGKISDNFAVAMQQRKSLNLDIISCEQSGIPEAQSWEYDQTEQITSIVNDWYLVCERLPLLSTVQGSYMFGVFVGCIVFGWASDRYGRRKTMLVASVIQAVSSVAAAFTNNYMQFVFFRFCIAFSVSGVFECGFVLVTEICGPKFRTYFGILTQFPFGIGASLLPIVAYFIRDWTTLQLTISLPCVLLVTYYWFVPESPRWLIQVGNFKEALRILKEGAKTNGNTLPPDEEVLAMMQKFKTQEDEIKHETDEKTTKEKLYEVFKELIILVETPEMRKRTLNIFYSWLVVAMVYYGLSFNSKNLGGNRYVSVFVSGFVEVPAVVVILPLLNSLGRMKCYCGTFIGGGIACGLVAIITLAFDSSTMIWLPVTIAMIGKFLISMTFAIAYLYTAELFPTQVRNVAVGTASTFARIGSMAAPYIVDLLGAIHPAIPVIIFGLFSCTAGVLALMLPETLNKRLPESVADVEKSAKGYHEEEMNAVGGGQPGDNAESKTEA
eukprot:maker-scaffold237_size242172-snap-gene-1.35 protein:Tk05178 transcript:maker-scaffold237_size242172-snap-gene-1.35-mRNA-1 annotation:"sugar transporter"